MKEQCVICKHLIRFHENGECTHDDCDCGGFIKDLGLKIGSKAEVEWTDLKTGQEKALLKSEIEGIVAKVLIELSDKQIAIEREKFK